MSRPPPRGRGATSISARLNLGEMAMARRNSSDPPNPERVAAFGLGLSAESRAAAYLVAKGYRIAARRFRSPVGEVDIVARRGRVLVFVEVKARATLDAAAESLQTRQQRRIAAAAAP